MASNRSREQLPVVVNGANTPLKISDKMVFSVQNLKTGCQSRGGYSTSTFLLIPISGKGFTVIINCGCGTCVCMETDWKSTPERWKNHSWNLTTSRSWLSLAIDVFLRFHAVIWEIRPGWDVFLRISLRNIHIVTIPLKSKEGNIF